jgi:hypothetical protein
MWFKPGDLKNMSRMEELSDHTKGRFSVTGCAGTRRLMGMLLQPVPFCVFIVNFD